MRRFSVSSSQPTFWLGFFEKLWDNSSWWDLCYDSGTWLRAHLYLIGSEMQVMAELSSVLSCNSFPDLNYAVAYWHSTTHSHIAIRYTFWRLRKSLVSHQASLCNVLIPNFYLCQTCTKFLWCAHFLPLQFLPYLLSLILFKILCYACV